MTPSAGTATSGLLGRDRDLAELRGAYSEAVLGRGSVVLLTGEGGIGKTRLAEEFSREAAQSGAEVRWGRVWEVEGAPPAWPWVQLLRPALQEASARRLLQDPSFAAQLAPLLPELGDGNSSAAAPQADTFRLASGLVATIECLAASAPQVLVLDDLHAADHTTLALLEAVARELRRLRVLVVGTMREVEARRQDEVSALLTRIARHGISIPLGRLDAQAIAQLVERTVGPRASPELQESVARASEGNPLFAAALARVATRGPQTTSRAALPDTIRDTLKASLEVLGAPCREVLDAASVLGREGSMRSLQQVTGLASDALGAALDEGWRAGVLDPPSSTAWRFSHVLLREVLEHDLSSARRTALHQRCTELLATLAEPEAVAELAHHAWAAGAWTLALDACARAGRRALELPDVEAASGWFVRALEAQAHSGEVDRALRAELLFEAGQAEIRLGQGVRGKERCLEAMALATELGSPGLQARAALAMGAQYTPGRVDAALTTALEQALAALPPGEGRLRALVMARLGAALMPSATPQRPLALARESVVLARAEGDARLLAQVMSTARSAFTPSEPLEERQAMDAELVQLALGLGARDLALQARCRLALDALERGDGEAFEAQLLEGDRLAEALRLPGYRWRLATLRLCQATSRSDELAYARCEAELQALASRMGHAELDAMVSVSRVLRARSLRKLEEEAAFMNDVRRTADQAGAPRVVLPALNASLLARQGRTEEVAALLAGLPPAAISLSRGPTSLALVGECMALGGDRALLEKVYALLLPYAEVVAVMTAIPMAWGPIAGFLARFAVALGREAEAERHFSTAVAVCERLGADAWLALTRADRDAWKARATPGPVVAPVERMAGLTLAREGEYWSMRLGDAVVRLKDSKGLQYLARLVAEPGREFHVADLVGAGAAGEGDGPGLGDAGELLDAKARLTYQRRLEELDEELREATGFRDAGRLEKALAEREALADELARAVGLGGRDRKAASSVERARINVQRRIRDVIARVEETSPPVARHLEAFVRTGMFCSYQG